TTPLGLVAFAFGPDVLTVVESAVDLIDDDQNLLYQDVREFRYDDIVELSWYTQGKADSATKVSAQSGGTRKWSRVVMDVRLINGRPIQIPLRDQGYPGMIEAEEQVKKVWTLIRDEQRKARARR